MTAKKSRSAFEVESESDSEGTRAYPIRRTYPCWWTSACAVAEEGPTAVTGGTAPVLADVEGAAVAAPETPGSEGG